MNTYYLVPEAEYRIPHAVQNFHSATDSIINDSHLNDYDRAIALQDSLSKYLNATRTGRKEGSLDKEKLKTVVLELLKDLQIPQPPPPPPRRPLQTPFKTPQILGTFYHHLLQPYISIIQMMKAMTLTRQFYLRGQLTLWLHPKSENNPRQKEAVAGLQGTD